MLLTRQSIPALKRQAGFTRAELFKGGYVVSGLESKDLVLIASGSEVSLAQQAAEQLHAQTGQKARVVSIPCLEVFMEQDKNYREQVIPSNSRKVLIEAASSWGWGNILGKDVIYVTKDDYGASAPDHVLAKEFGFSADSVVQKILA